MPYTYRQAGVLVPKSAEISTAFQFTGHFSAEVQTALQDVKPWEQGEDPVHTFNLSRAIGARAVALAEGESPLWGVHPHQRARDPGVSPFIRISDERQRTDKATVELSGTPQRPVLTRVYSGEYMPPLPWMATARRVDGGLHRCEEFWRTHAFLLKTSVNPSSLTRDAPEWYGSL